VVIQDLLPLPPTIAMTMQGKWDVLKGLICAVEVFGMRRVKKGVSDLPLSSYQHSLA